MHRLLVSLPAWCLITLVAAPVRAECTSQTLVIDSGADITCPCFVPDEIVMTIHDVPAGMTATATGCQIAWGNPFGLPGSSTEDALIVYTMNQDGPVNPATFQALAEFPDPHLTAGSINQFTFAGPAITLPAKRFGIGLRFRNTVTGILSNTITMDDNGHNNGPNTIRNWIFSDAGQWISAQSAGTSGDWVIRALIEACTAATGPDLNGDGHVNGVDLGIMLGQWTGPVSYSPCPRFSQPDLNQDCKINGLDLAILLAAWDP